MRAMGAGFDFLQHEAVETVCTDKQAENRIIEEVQSGYMRKDRGLRAAKVMVTIAGRAKHFKSNWHRFVNEQFGAADMIGGKLIHHPLTEGTTLGGKAFRSYVAFTRNGQGLVGEPTRLPAATNPGTCSSEKARSACRAPENVVDAEYKVDEK